MYLHGKGLLAAGYSLWKVTAKHIVKIIKIYDVLPQFCCNISGRSLYSFYNPRQVFTFRGITGVKWALSAKVRGKWALSGIWSSKISRYSPLDKGYLYHSTCIYTRQCCFKKERIGLLLFSFHLPVICRLLTWGGELLIDRRRQNIQTTFLVSEPIPFVKGTDSGDFSLQNSFIRLLLPT